MAKIYTHNPSDIAMSCFNFKHMILSCVHNKRKQITPNVLPSPPGPTSPGPILTRSPSTLRKASYGSEPVSPVKMTRSLSHKSHFTPSKTMSSKGGMSFKYMSRSDSQTESPRMQRSASRSHQPMFCSTSSGLMKPLQMEQILECTLDELCFGCVKHCVVFRAIVTSTGSMSIEEESLTVKVKPGWKKGTTITFLGGENKETGSHSGDVVFLVEEKEHERFKRQDGNEEDLEVEIGLALVDAITGCKLSIPLIGGGQMILAIDDIIEPGSERVIQGQGMPKKKDPSQRGDLKVKFRVEFPKNLTDFQKSKILKIYSGIDDE